MVACPIGKAIQIDEALLMCVLLYKLLLQVNVWNIMCPVKWITTYKLCVKLCIFLCELLVNLGWTHP